jgi:hypothetical protein
MILGLVTEKVKITIMKQLSMYYFLLLVPPSFRSKYPPQGPVLHHALCIVLGLHEIESKVLLMSLPCWVVLPENCPSVGQR